MKNIFRITGFVVLIFAVYSCKKDKPSVPTITTTSVTEISYTTANVGGDLTNEGGASVVSKGVCWSISADPTIENSKTIESGESGTFKSNITQLTPNTLYYVRAYATNIGGTGYGNQVSFTTSQISKPSLTTKNIANITETSALCGGTITSENGGYVSSRGVCWDKRPNPTIANSINTNGSDTGSFTCSIFGLAEFTTYYVRAYATNSEGTSYGNEVRFTTFLSSNKVADIDSNVYNTISIGTQIWLVENLKTTKYQNGQLIGTTTPAGKDISGENTPKYQWAYSGYERFTGTYGRLYTWYAVTDSRNVCPTGWHVPTSAEWTTLTDYLTKHNFGMGLSYWIAKSMASKTEWKKCIEIFGNGTNGSESMPYYHIGYYPEYNNSSGFTGFPGGVRFYPGIFDNMSEFGFWWASTEFNVSEAKYIDLYYNLETVGISPYPKANGLSVRCVKD